MITRKRIAAWALLLLIGLGACAPSPGTPGGEPPAGGQTATEATAASAAAPTEAPATTPAEAPAEPSPYFWEPPEKPSPDSLGDRRYWERQFWYIYGAYDDAYQSQEYWELDTLAFKGYVPLLMRDGVLRKLDRDEKGYAVLTWEQFLVLCEVYFGPEYAARVTPEDAELPGGADWDGVEYADGALHIPILEQYFEPTTNYGYEFTEVIPLDEGLDRVELLANSYTTIHSTPEEEERRELSKEHHYILRWDGRVGYVPESITGEYVPTDRVSITGDTVRELGALWDMEATGSAHLSYQGQIDSMADGAIPARNDPVYTSGEEVYRFRAEGNSILYDRLNLETLEQGMGHTLMTAESAPSQSVWRVGDGFAFYADRALHLFDGALSPQRSVPVPEEIADAGFAIDEGFETLAYLVGGGLYLYDLAAAESRLIYTYAYDDYPDFDMREEWYGLYPVRFTAEGDIFVGVGYWDSRGIQYLLISRDGEELADVRWNVTGLIGGGYSFSNAAGAIHSDADVGADAVDWHYLDFATHTEKGFGGLPFDFHEHMGMAALPAPGGDHQWYFSEPRGPWELPDETSFHLVDFAAGASAELPLKVNGAKAALMAVSDSGRMLFNYAYNGERGFAVYK